MQTLETRRNGGGHRLYHLCLFSLFFLSFFLSISNRPLDAQGSFVALNFNSGYIWQSESW